MARRNPLQPDPRKRSGKSQLAGLLLRLGPALVLAILALVVTLWPAGDAPLAEPLGSRASPPEQVSQRFTRCGRGRGYACVTDGDTFKLGKRKIRILGIDAPEVNGRCESERRLAEASTLRLLALLNQGPFVMTGRLDDMRDRYGRDLRSLTRRRPDGTVQSIADEMRQSGHARRYIGYKQSWCPA